MNHDLSSTSFTDYSAQFSALFFGMYMSLFFLTYKELCSKYILNVSCRFQNDM